MLAYFKRQRAIKDLLTRIIPCFAPVQDEIGNVPPATHADPRILASLYAVIYATLDAGAIGNEQNKKLVTDVVFEEIFRREATVILNQCDQWMLDTDSEFYQLFDADLKSAQSAQSSQDQVLSELASYIDSNYERQEYRDL